MVYRGYGVSPVVLDMILSGIDPSSSPSKAGRTSIGRRIPIDILENDHCFEILADIPGVQKKAIELGIDKGILTLSVSRQDTAPAVPSGEAETPAVTNPAAEAAESGDVMTPASSERLAQPKLLHQERALRFAQRSVKLPETANLEQARAEYEAGVLKVKVPKKILSSPKRISIA